MWELSLHRVQRDDWEAAPAQSHREIWNSHNHQITILNRRPNMTFSKADWKVIPDQVWQKFHRSRPLLWDYIRFMLSPSTYISWDFFKETDWTLVNQEQAIGQSLPVKSLYEPPKSHHAHWDRWPLQYRLIGNHWGKMQSYRLSHFESKFSS